jgi:hypothetical protein
LYSPVVNTHSNRNDVFSFARSIVIYIYKYLCIADFYQVRQGCSWSRNYKSLSSSPPSPSPTRFRIFRCLSSPVCPRPTYTQFSINIQRNHSIFKRIFKIILNFQNHNQFSNYTQFSKFYPIFKIILKLFHYT